MLRNSVSVHRGRISPLEIRCMFPVLFCVFYCVRCSEEVVARTRAVVLVFFFWVLGLGSWVFAN